MSQSLRDQQAAAEAVFSTVADVEVPASFNNDAAALEAAKNGVALCDRSHWGRIQVAGADRIRFLHNQTTNDFNRLQPGQGCDTVFVNSTARTIDLVSAYVLPEAVWLLTSPGYSQRLIDWMDRFIFFADKVDLKDITPTTITFSLLGPASDALLCNLGAAGLVGQPYGTHQLLDLGGVPAHIAVGSGLVNPGYSLIADINESAALWQLLTEAGAIPLGEQVWEQLRVEQGRPVPGLELTDDYNPLEAGLWYTISLSKGCYIGQETIARLHTYHGVKQQLWGVRLDAAAPPETAVMVGGEKIGKLTSCIQTEQGYTGLAYIRTKALSPGLKVQVGEQSGELVAVPFITHEYP